MNTIDEYKKAFNELVANLMPENDVIKVLGIKEHTLNCYLLTRANLLPHITFSGNYFLPEAVLDYHTKYGRKAR